MDQLHAGIEVPLAVLPPPPVLLSRCKAALAPTSLGDHRACVQFTALSKQHLRMRFSNVSDPLGIGLADIATSAPSALSSVQVRAAVLASHLCRHSHRPCFKRAVPMLFTLCASMVKSALGALRPDSFGPWQPDFSMTCSCGLPP